MNAATKATLLIVFFVTLTFLVIFITGMMSGTMDNRWMMWK